MKKKTLALCGIAVLAGLTLASCKDKDNDDNGGGTVVINGHVYANAPEDVEYAAAAGDVDIYINYQGESGITYRKSDPWNNPIDGNQYNQGSLLPTWVAIASKTKTTIREACSYTAKDTFVNAKTNGYKSETDENQKIDLMFGQTNATQLNNGDFINLLEDQYLNQMPNFKKWLNDYPSFADQMKQAGGTAIYYTPYAEGFNDIERMLVMDTQIVQKVLDADNFDAFDTGKKNGGTSADANVVQKGYYTPFIDATNNYPDKETTVKVLYNKAATDLKIKQTKNIIVQQNELLNRDNGCTGKELAEQFRAYLQAAFGDNVGEGKMFKTYSEIFTSATAAYNADELVALMRVVKANPKLITGDENKEVETFFPRGEQNNRVEAVYQLSQIWGVQGVQNAINQKLYFSADGKLNDALTTKATYDALDYLQALYNEGLIIDNFWYKPASNATQTRYLDRYFIKSSDDAGYGLMMFDFAAATTAANDMINGVGTLASKRKITYESKGIMPILPPLTYWATQTNWDHNQDLSNKTGKTLTRYVESNKGLKSGSWGIPKTSDNIPGALRIMDYLFSEKGNMIQCFGPEIYWQQPNTAEGDVIQEGTDTTKTMVSVDLLGGVKSPIISTETKALLAQATNFYNFMRENLGATHGIGHLRHAGLDLQACNEYGQEGLSNLKAAYGEGVVVQNVNETTYHWYTTTPKKGSHNDTTTQIYPAITNFWPTDCCAATATGWVKVVSSPVGTNLENTIVSTDGSSQWTYKQVKDNFDARNKSFLYAYARALSEDAIPDYAKA